jgi:hypothetical protein
LKRKRCSIEGCNAYVWARGKCRNHDAKENPQKYRLNTKLSKPLKKSRKPLSPVSEKQALKLKEYRLKRDKFLEENPVCMVEGCKGKSELHHARGRIGENLTDVSTFRNLCRRHHQWVELHPEEARKLGLTENRL